MGILNGVADFAKGGIVGALSGGGAKGLAKAGMFGIAGIAATSGKKKKKPGIGGATAPFAPAPADNDDQWSNGALSAMGLGSRGNSAATLEAHLNGQVEGELPADVRARYDAYVAANPRSNSAPASTPAPAPAPAAPAAETAPVASATPAQPAAGIKAHVMPSLPSQPAADAPVVNGFKGDQWQFADDRVDVELDRITSSDSPLMKRARGIGMAVANRRGLQNSSIAAGTAEKAMIDAAMPMASQNAGQSHSKNMQRMGADSQRDLTRLNIEAQNEQQRYDLDGRRGLQREAIDADMERTRFGADAQAKLNQSSLSVQQQSNLAQLLATASNTYASQIQSINANPDMKAAARSSAYASAKAQYDRDVAMFQKMYGANVNLTWGKAA